MPRFKIEVVTTVKEARYVEAVSEVDALLHAATRDSYSERFEEHDKKATIRPATADEWAAQERKMNNHRLGYSPMVQLQQAVALQQIQPFPTSEEPAAS